MNEQTCTELGERKASRGKRAAWACRKMLQGFYCARYGWDLDTEPKRLFAYVDGFGDLQYARVRKSDGTTELFKLSWQDATAPDWYIPENLELVR